MKSWVRHWVVGQMGQQIKSGWVTWVIDPWPINQWLNQSNFKNVFNNFRYQTYKICDFLLWYVLWHSDEWINWQLSPPSPAAACVHTIQAQLHSALTLYPTPLALKTVYRGLYMQIAERWTLRSVGRGFKSYSRQRCITTLGKLFTPMYLCHQAV